MGGLTGEAVYCPCRVGGAFIVGPIRESRHFGIRSLTLYVQKGRAQAIKYYPFLHMSAITFHFEDN